MESTENNDAAGTPEAEAAASVPQPDSGRASPAAQEVNHFSRSESQALGFTGKVKAMFTGKRALSTMMTMGYLFTWSERVLTYFRTGFSSYRDIPKIVTGKGLEGQGRLSPLKNAGSSIAKLFVPGSDNNFLSKYSTGEKLEAMATAGGLAQNIWFLLSSREGDIPEGDTWLARFKDVITHPTHHAAQMGSIWMGAVMAAMAAGRIMIGVDNLSQDDKGNRIGFNPGKVLAGKDGIAKAEKLMPLIAGISLLIYAPLTLYGILNIKKTPAHSSAPSEKDQAELAAEAGGDIAVSTEESHSHPKSFASGSSRIQTAGKKGTLQEILSMFTPGHLKDMWQYAVHNDPIGIVGRTMGFGLDIGSFVVGFARLKQIESGQYAHKFGAVHSPEWNRARANAIQTRNVGILGFVLTGLYNMYVYDTVMQASKKEQEAPKAGNDGKMAR